MSTPAPIRAVRRRLTRHIARYGTSLTYTRGGSTFTFAGRVSVMSPTVRSAWFKTAEVDTWSQRPAYVVTVAGDLAPFASAIINGSDAVTINGIAYTIRKHDRVRLGDIIVRTVLYCTT
jgi:hypothetical protein